MQAKRFNPPCSAGQMLNILPDLQLATDLPAATDLQLATDLPAATDLKAAPRQKRRFKAMTLTELLVVLAILGILVLMAYPVVMPIFQKAHSTEAKMQLKHLCTLQKTYFLEHARYSKELKSIGYEQAPLQEMGGTAKYRLEVVEASTNSFRAQAVSVVDFDGDGQMNIWEVDQGGQPREVVED